jgi:hypothetical protein
MKHCCDGQFIRARAAQTAYDVLVFIGEDRRIFLHWRGSPYFLLTKIAVFCIGEDRPYFFALARIANIFLHSKIQRRGAQRSQLLPPLFLSPTIKSNVAVIIQHKSGRAANITNHTSMKQSKQLVPKFILTRQGISVQIGPYLSHKAV